MASEAFTDYLQLCAEKVGFTESITFYSLRCDTAQELAVEESGIRMSDLQWMSNEFNRRIIAQAKASVGPQNSDSDLIEEDALRTLGVDFGNAFEEDPTTGGSERDPEGQFQERIEHDEEAQTFPDEVSIGDVLDQMDYATVARCAMEIWLFAGNETSSWGGKQAKMAPCPSCQSDETVDDETKSKHYDANNLKRHLDGDFHSRFKQFSRRAEIVARDEGLPGVRCEICVAIAPPGTVIPVYSTVTTLARHITGSELTKMQAIEREDAWRANEEVIDPSTVGQTFIAHDALKRSSGWYDEDFPVDSSSRQPGS